MTTGELYTAPAWTKGSARWRVRLAGRPLHGSVPIRWLEGPLAGREARLETKTLQRATAATVNVEG